MIRAALFEDQQTPKMLALLSILVCLLHMWLINWLLRPLEKPTSSTPPLQMEVSMVSVSAPIPNSTPKPVPPTPPAPQPPEKKVEPKKPITKPEPKKTPTVTQKSPDAVPKKKIMEQASPPVTAPTSPATDSKATTSPAAQTTDNNAVATAVDEKVTEPDFKAAYLHNPPPEYPSIARSRGWEGTVKLRVWVSAEGLPEKIEVEQSSGHEILDEDALEFVKKNYRFTPKKHGETAVAGTVIVPIKYYMKE